MARKQSGISLPSGQGGLVGGFSSSLHTRFELSPKLVIYFSLGTVVFIWMLFNNII